MVRPWFSAEKEKDEGLARVGFVRVVVAAAMSYFLGCLRIKDYRSHVMSGPQKPLVSRSKHGMASLFLSDDDILRNGRKARISPSEEVDAIDLKNEAKVLKECGTLPETPVEIRKTLVNWVDTSAKNDESRNFNSWLPTASFEKLKMDKQPDQPPPHVVKYSEEWVTEAGCLVNTPSSCMNDGRNTRRNSSIQSSDIQNVPTPMDLTPDSEIHSSAILSVSTVAFAKTVRGKNKSVRFECQSDNSTFSSETSSTERSGESGSAGSSSSESKPSPYPTPLKLTDDMQTPGTLFPAYLNNMADGKANRVRSQYVYSVLNPTEYPIIWEDLKNENPDSDSSNEYLEPNEEESLIPTSGTSIKDISVRKIGKSEPAFSWFKPCSDDQNGENVRFGRTPGDRPILGSSHITLKWWDGNGIPNSTNKYKEDQKVIWHATPFEERLEKALSDGTFVSQRKAY